MMKVKKVNSEKGLLKITELPFSPFHFSTFAFTNYFMLVFLYRWRIKPEKEAQFIEAWSEITAYYRENFGSRGSRLHRGDDRIFYAYAQWDSADERENAFRNSPESEAGNRMREAIEESFEEVRLEILADYLV